MFSWITSKVLGGVSIALLLALAAMGWKLHRTAEELEDTAATLQTVTTWKTEVTAATRNAAHHPKLAEHNVAQQVRNMGTAIDTVRRHMAQTRRDALAAKRAAEDRNERNRKDKNDDFRDKAIDVRRRGADYIRTHGVHGPAKNPAPDRGDHRSNDLPQPTFGAGVADGSGAQADMVAVSVGDFEICGINTARLENAQEWYAETLAPRPAPETVQPGGEPENLLP